MTCMARNRPQTSPLLALTSGSAVSPDDADEESDPMHAALNDDSKIPGCCCCQDRPHHALDGLAMGICSSLTGIGLGCVSVILQPILCSYGSYQMAAASNPDVGAGCSTCLVGFVGGCICGVACGAVSIVVGLSVGVAQVVRGVVHTPETISARLQGKEWDDRRQEWIFYDLKEEADIVFGMTAQSYMEFASKCGASFAKKSSASMPKSNTNAQRVAKETELYDILGVNTQATSGQIKKAYFKLAKQCHPDKNPNDPNAKKQFQELSDAYQILSDDNARKKYDTEGRAGLAGQPKLDAQDFYAQIFGSEEFEHFVGKMAIVTMLEMSEDHGEEQGAELKLAQWQREVRCAVSLVELLKPFVSEAMDETQFRASMSDLGKKLCAGAMGGSLLSCIGYCYQQGARHALGSSNVSGGIWERLVGMQTSLSDGRRLLGEYVHLGNLVMQIVESSSSGQGNADADTSAQKDLAKAAVHLWWQVTVMEIEMTLEAVCTKVTHDTSVEKDERRRRAIALSIVGEVFLSLGTSSEAGMDILSARMGA